MPPPSRVRREEDRRGEPPPATRAHQGPLLWAGLLLTGAIWARRRTQVAILRLTSAHHRTALNLQHQGLRFSATAADARHAWRGGLLPPNGHTCYYLRRPLVPLNCRWLLRGGRYSCSRPWPAWRCRSLLRQAARSVGSLTLLASAGSGGGCTRRKHRPTRMRCVDHASLPQAAAQDKAVWSLSSSPVPPCLPPDARHRLAARHSDRRAPGCRGRLELCCHSLLRPQCGKRQNQRNATYNAPCSKRNPARLSGR